MSHTTEGSQSSPPDWFVRAAELEEPLEAWIAHQLESKASQYQDLGGDFHASMLPAFALRHLSDGIASALEANALGRHAVALGLTRGCVEALTIIELGLVANENSWGVLRAWHDGRKTQGDLRKYLEAAVWPTYGHGLWNEPWAEFAASLARSLQPYAHFSPELLQWQMKMISGSESLTERQGLALLGPGIDPSKGERIGLLMSLTVWVLGRLALHHTSPPPGIRDEILGIGSVLATSRWLTEGEDWADQLVPHIFLLAKPND